MSCVPTVLPCNSDSQMTGRRHPLCHLFFCDGENGENMMSRKGKLLNYLQKGNTVTAKQITGSFGLKNPHDAIFQLRNEGYCVYSNPAKLSDGTKTTKYRIGNPTRKMIATANAVLGSSAFTR